MEDRVIRATYAEMLTADSAVAREANTAHLSEAVVRHCLNAALHLVPVSPDTGEIDMTLPFSVALGPGTSIGGKITVELLAVLSGAA